MDSVQNQAENQSLANGGDDVFVYGHSAAMRAVERVIANIAMTDVPVLIVGEGGTGKRAAARQIHLQSGRSNKPFVQVRCDTLTADFFQPSAGPRDNGGGGHDGPDPFLASGTTLLEEIADLDSACQSKLLQALVNSEAAGGGGRIVSATRKLLEREVRSGRFREDLYYRINGVCLRIPPLRHRREDIAPLLQHFLVKFARVFDRRVPQFGPQTLALLCDYPWPGNVRELENTARAMVASGDEDTALASLRRSPRRGTRVPMEGVSLKEAARAAGRQAERELILKALEQTHWNRKRAAQQLQISYKALLYKLKQIGADDYATP